MQVVMQWANLSRVWIVEEVRQVALATPVDWSLLVIIKQMVLFIGL